MPAAGRSYPAEIPGWSRLFQHFAVTAPDMAAATARLGQFPDWTAISSAGPQQLPVAAGGVTAFKFRDPEGHPLELITFPGEGANTPSRIDHSALSVAETERSIAFYQGLGLTVGARSLNRGPEQDRLDGLDAVEVEVTALNLPDGGAHIELLCYRGPCRRDAVVAALDDVAATRLVLLGSGGPSILHDPDGHVLQVEPIPAVR